MFRMNVHQENQKALVIIILLFTFFNFSCTRKIYPAETIERKKKAAKGYNNSVKSVKNKELEAFLTKGSGKYLNTGKTSPEDIIRTARKFMGTPYCMGGSSKKCTDCSGLLMAAFAEHGISLPHNSEAQARYGKIIMNKAALQEGDLVFFIKTYKTSKFITHVGIYTGNNKMIHTSSSKGVMISSLDNTYWREKFIFGTRVFNPDNQGIYY